MLSWRAFPSASRALPAAWGCFSKAPAPADFVARQGSHRLPTLGLHRPKNGVYDARIRKGGLEVVLEGRAVADRLRERLPLQRVVIRTRQGQELPAVVR